MTHRPIAWLFVALAAPPAIAAGERPVRVKAHSPAAVGEWSDRIDALLASRELAVRLTRADTMISGRQHERLAQLHRGVPVFGGELIRQSDPSGPLTVFGTFYDGIEIDVTPRLGSRAVEALLAGLGGRPFGSRGGPELVVLPRSDGYHLAFRVRAFFDRSLDVRQYFFDATTGDVLLEYRDLQTQAAGIGTGVLGDRKKISVALATGGWSYYYKLFGRRGLDDANIAIHSITHSLRREDWRG